MEKRKPIMPGLAASVVLRDFDWRFSSAFTSIGMTEVSSWMTKFTFL